jgi:predicted small secreted protein
MFKQILIILVVIALALTVTGCCCCSSGSGYDYGYYSEVQDTTASGCACGQCDGSAACGANGCPANCDN